MTSVNWRDGITAANAHLKLLQRPFRSHFLRGAAADPAEVIERAKRECALAFDATAEAVSLYLNLLVGDLQIRRVISQDRHWRRL